MKWHIVADNAGILSGVVTSDDGNLVVMLAGTIDAVVNIDRHAKSQFNAEQVGTFSMVGTEVGSKNRIADVTGTIEPNGWLNANIKGVGVACDHIKLLPLLTPAAPH